MRVPRQEQSLNFLTEREKDQIEHIYSRWLRALREKQYGAADTLEKELKLAGMLPPEYTSWNSRHESTSYRQMRKLRREE